MDTLDKLLDARIVISRINMLINKVEDDVHEPEDTRLVTKIRIIINEYRGKELEVKEGDYTPSKTQKIIRKDDDTDFDEWDYHGTD